MLQVDTEDCQTGDRAQSVEPQFALVDASRVPALRGKTLGTPKIQSLRCEALRIVGNDADRLRPAPEKPAPGTMRVLMVGDLIGLTASWEVMRSLIEYPTIRLENTSLIAHR